MKKDHRSVPVVILFALLLFLPNAVQADWFAGLAMQALLGYEESTVQNDVEFAYQYADAMMKQREMLRDLALESIQ